jgi:SAM-dependent methyltransferase
VNELRDEVRERYAAAARVVATGRAADDNGADITSCCDGCAPQDGIGVALYEPATRAELPDEAVLASMGCGNPTVVAELREGETVLDLGSGGGIDVLLSAKRVGPTGKAYGLDMTDEMLELARENARKAGADNVEFLRGFIEDVPLPDASVDVIISNCVINLSTDKPRVVDEMFRVLRPGGRLGISDVVSDDRLSPADRAERGSYVGCIAGALSFSEYRDELVRAGFVDVEILPTHELTDGIHGAIVRGVKPPEAV